MIKVVVNQSGLHSNLEKIKKSVEWLLEDIEVSEHLIIR